MDLKHGFWLPPSDNMDRFLCLVILSVFLVEGIACYCPVVPYGVVVNPRDPKTVGAPKKVITGIKGPHSIVFTRSNEVYITGWFDGFLYRLDLAGNIKEKFKVPTGNPSQLDIRGDTLYITNAAKTVYIKQLLGHKPFRPFLDNQNRPFGLRISEDGLRVYVSELLTGIIRVYDNNLKLIGTMRIPAPDKHPHKIMFDANGNVNVAGYSPRIYVYNKHNCFVRAINHPGTQRIDGFVNYADGSRVLADRGGQVVFADKNGKTIKSIRGYGMREPADVAIAPDSDRTLWVADVIGHKVYLF